ncbi:probable N-acetyltransferase CML1 isoform X1 [Bufo gargarizans]|uniref:probable N-acetyltransferase CML1 isoform X1 n=2 Tax=Bufo gargarizans TaxID=30331 RepID=UPI001CF10B75|nr:probable N-acetyltransferase CML1 isoform X1 [Bufo gargarizans]
MANMSDYQIRLYKDSDYERVREIFANGMKEHSTKAFQISLRLPRIWIFLLLMFLLLFWITGSFLMSVLAVIIDIGLLFCIHKLIYTVYASYCLKDDLLDIQKYYLQRDGYCFWVVESSGEIAGMVAAMPSPNPGGERQVELKRLSVPRKYRGKGIAKVLCRTVIDYARKRGCEAVVLETSYPQVDAWKMYEKMGFKRTRSFFTPTLLGRLLCFRVLLYRYDLPVPR